MNTDHTSYQMIKPMAVIAEINVNWTEKGQVRTVAYVHIHKQWQYYRTLYVFICWEIEHKHIPVLVSMYLM